MGSVRANVAQVTVDILFSNLYNNYVVDKFL